MGNQISQSLGENVNEDSSIPVEHFTAHLQKEQIVRSLIPECILNQNAQVFACKSEIKPIPTGFLKYIGLEIRDTAKEQAELNVVEPSNQPFVQSRMTQKISDKKKISDSNMPSRIDHQKILYCQVVNKYLKKNNKNRRVRKSRVDRNNIKKLIDRAKAMHLVITTTGDMFGRELLRADSSSQSEVDVFITPSPFEDKVYVEKIPVLIFFRKLLEEQSVLVFYNTNCKLCLDERIIKLSVYYISQFFKYIIVFHWQSLTLLKLLMKYNIKHVALRLDRMGVHGDCIAAILNNEFSNGLPSNVYFHGKHESFIKLSPSVVEQNGQTNILSSLLPYAYDIIVLGSTPVGLAAVFEARRLNQRVCLIDETMTTFCLPLSYLGISTLSDPTVSKKIRNQLRLHLNYMQELSLQDDRWCDPKTRNKIFITWLKLMETARKIVKIKSECTKWNLHTAGAGYFNCGIKLVDRHTVEMTNPLNEKLALRSSYFLISTQMRHRIPDIKGYEHCKTPDQLLTMTHSPGKTLIYGDTRSAIEYAGFLGSLGFPVTIMAPGNIMRGYDSEMVKGIIDNMKNYGVEIINDCTLKSIQLIEKGSKLMNEKSKGKRLPLHRFRQNSVTNIRKADSNCNKSNIEQPRKPKRPLTWHASDIIRDICKLKYVRPQLHGRVVKHLLRNNKLENKRDKRRYTCQSGNIKKDGTSKSIRNICTTNFTVSSPKDKQVAFETYRSYNSSLKTEKWIKLSLLDINNALSNIRIGKRIINYRNQYLRFSYNILLQLDAMRKWISWKMKQPLSKLRRTRKSYRNKQKATQFINENLITGLKYKVIQQVILQILEKLDSLLKLINSAMPNDSNLTESIKSVIKASNKNRKNNKASVSTQPFHNSQLLKKDGDPSMKKLTRTYKRKEISIEDSLNVIEILRERDRQEAEKIETLEMLTEYSNSRPAPSKRLRIHSNRKIKTSQLLKVLDILLIKDKKYARKNMKSDLTRKPCESKPLKFSFSSILKLNESSLSNFIKISSPVSSDKEIVDLSTEINNKTSKVSLRKRDKWCQKHLNREIMKSKSINVLQKLLKRDLEKIKQTNKTLTQTPSESKPIKVSLNSWSSMLENLFLEDNLLSDRRLPSPKSRHQVKTTKTNNAISNEPTLAKKKNFELDENKINLKEYSKLLFGDKLQLKCPFSHRDTYMRNLVLSETIKPKTIKSLKTVSFAAYKEKTRKNRKFFLKGLKSKLQNLPIRKENEAIMHDSSTLKDISKIFMQDNEKSNIEESVGFLVNNSLIYNPPKISLYELDYTDKNKSGLHNKSTIEDVSETRSSSNISECSFHSCSEKAGLSFASMEIFPNLNEIEEIPINQSQDFEKQQNFSDVGSPEMASRISNKSASVSKVNSGVSLKSAYNHHIGYYIQEPNDSDYHIIRSIHGNTLSGEIINIKTNEKCEDDVNKQDAGKRVKIKAKKTRISKRKRPIPHRKTRAHISSYHRSSDNASYSAVVALGSQTDIGSIIDKKLKKVKEKLSCSNFFENSKRYRILSKFVKVLTDETQNRALLHLHETSNKLFQKHPVYEVIGEFDNPNNKDFKEQFNTILVAGAAIEPAQDINLDNIGVLRNQRNGKLYANRINSTTVPNIFCIGECVHGWRDEHISDIITTRHHMKRIFCRWEEMPAEVPLVTRVTQTYPYQYAFLGLSGNDAVKRYSTVISYIGSFNSLQYKSILKIICNTDEDGIETVIGIHLYDKRAFQTINDFIPIMKKQDLILSSTITKMLLNMKMERTVFINGLKSEKNFEDIENQTNLNPSDDRGRHETKSSKETDKCEESSKYERNCERDISENGSSENTVGNISEEYSECEVFEDSETSIYDETKELIVDKSFEEETMTDSKKIMDEISAGDPQSLKSLNAEMPKTSEFHSENQSLRKFEEKCSDNRSTSVSSMERNFRNTTGLCMRCIQRFEQATESSTPHTRFVIMQQKTSEQKDDKNCGDSIIYVSVCRRCFQFVQKFKQSLKSLNAEMPRTSEFHSENQSLRKFEEKCSDTHSTSEGSMERNFRNTTGLCMRCIQRFEQATEVGSSSSVLHIIPEPSRNAEGIEPDNNRPIEENIVNHNNQRIVLVCRRCFRYIQETIRIYRAADEAIPSRFELDSEDDSQASGERQEYDNDICSEDTSTNSRENSRNPGLCARCISILERNCQPLRSCSLTVVSPRAFEYNAEDEESSEVYWEDAVSQESDSSEIFQGFHVQPSQGQANETYDIEHMTASHGLSLSRLYNELLKVIMNGIRWIYKYKKNT